MILLLAACASKNPTATITVGDKPVKVEVVSTYAGRQLGLMHRDSMPADSGMLFVYKNEEIRHFWMKDTRIPLSIAFADRKGIIVHIDDMEPFDTSSTSSLLPATYALEMNKGWFSSHGIEEGAKITGIPTDLTIE